MLEYERFSLLVTPGWWWCDRLDFWRPLIHAWRDIDRLKRTCTYRIWRARHAKQFGQWVPYTVREKKKAFYIGKYFTAVNGLVGDFRFYIFYIFLACSRGLSKYIVAIPFTIYLWRNIVVFRHCQRWLRSVIVGRLIILSSFPVFPVLLYHYMYTKFPINPLF